METIRQYPTPPNEWLYQDQDGEIRIFTDYVIRSSESAPWAECTDAEKVEWEQAHPIPSPEEVGA